MYYNLRDKQGRFTSKKNKGQRAPKEKKLRDCFVGFVLDESGSMASVTKSTQDGFNENIQSLIESNDGLNTLVTLVRFKDRTMIETPYQNKELSPDLKISDYRPYGGTPLYDSIAKCIGILDQVSTKDSQVILTIFTDGDENQSSTYNMFDGGLKRLNELITNRKDKKKWMINFIGCGDLSKIQATAGSMGINFANTSSYASNTDENIKGIFTVSSRAGSNLRTNYSSGADVSNDGFFSNK